MEKRENREKNRKDVGFIERSTYTHTCNLHEQHSWLKKRREKAMCIIMNWLKTEDTEVKKAAKGKKKYKSALKLLQEKKND